MANVKKLISFYWLIAEGYDGDVSVVKDHTDRDATFYIIKTEGNDFEAVNYGDNVVFFHETGEVGGWETNVGAETIELDGLPRIAPFSTERPIPTFSEILRNYRDEKNLTVPALAKKIGVPQRTAESWLGGVSEPNLFVAKTVLKTLEIL